MDGTGEAAGEAAEAAEATAGGVAVAAAVAAAAAAGDQPDEVIPVPSRQICIFCSPCCLTLKPNIERVIVRKALLLCPIPFSRRWFFYPITPNRMSDTRWIVQSRTVRCFLQCSAETLVIWNEQIRSEAACWLPLSALNSSETTAGLDTRGQLGCK